MKNFRFAVWRPFYGEVEVSANSYEEAFRLAAQHARVIPPSQLSPGEAFETEVLPENLGGSTPAPPLDNEMPSAGNQELNRST
jgi:hypothetical protein